MVGTSLDLGCSLLPMAPKHVQLCGCKGLKDGV